MIHEVCSVDAGKKLVRTHGSRIINATVMIPLIAGDTPRALFPLVSPTKAAAGIRQRAGRFGTDFNPARRRQV